MKANLPVREPELLKWWDDKKIYHKLLEKNKSRPTFAFPDGPPYANASIHVGHCLNKILKDFVAKYKNMTGFQTHFIPGWDCHGLPIEHQVTKDLGPARAQKTDADIRSLCRAHAEKYVGVQRDQFKRLGIFGEWEHPYKTLDPEYEAANMVELGKIADSGNLYRGEKPIYWCAACRTALAEAEVEYKDHVSPSVYVSFDVKSGIEKLGKIDSKIPAAVVIWTTTPWTLPANLAISLHPDFMYAAFEAVRPSQDETSKIQKENWIIACDLKTEVEKVTGWTLTLVSEPKKGSELEGLVTSHPFISGQDSRILIGDHVTLDAGTGAVHTAPGHGQEDYQVCLKYNIAVYCPVDDAGKFSTQVKVPELVGMKVFDANPKVIEILKSNGHLIHEEKLSHSYPHCWRSKTPVIFRATPQWFIAMDGRDGSKKVRAAALAAIKEVKWVPTWGENRITAMVENRPDWCISRQRMWGVPIPVLYCEECGEAKANSATMNRAAAIVAKKGIEGWYEAAVEEISGGAACDKCASKKFKKGKDILDVWFDSGVCYAAVQEKRKGLTFPADLYLEGSDQHRGWFQSSLLTAISARGIAPFKTILTHGFVNDGDGKKMSKSVGNVLDPHKVIAGSGAEILRLWVAFEDYSSDLTAGKESFDRVTETYRRVRNTFRYMLGNLNDFDPMKNAVPYEKLGELDQWALSRLANFVDETIKHYNEYEFHKIYQDLQNYFTVDLSATYLDILKDRLYTFGKDSLERRSSQTVLFEIVRRTGIVMAPILSFLAEEVYQTSTHKPFESVFLEEIQACPTLWKNDSLEKNWQKLLELRSVVLKPLEEARQQKLVGAALEAKVNVEANGDFFVLSKKYESFLPDLFIVSQVSLSESKLGGVQVKIEKAKGEKCVRCWHYDTLSGAQDPHPNVCPKCIKALKLNEAKT